MHLDEYQCYVKDLVNKNMIFHLKSEKDLQNMLVEIAICSANLGVNLQKIADDSLDELVRDRYDG